MNEQSAIALKRAVEAVQIPSGNQINLPAETLVILTQQLGDSYTVYVVHQAGLFRIRGEDGDALGLEKISTVVAGAEFSEEAVWAQLRECYDPEIPVNSVDLGLIYGMQIADDAAGK